MPRPRYHRGLIIGKFMPPHAGHRFLIETAARRVRELTIILFTKKAEPVPGELRLRWLRAMARPHRVIHVTDEYRVDYDDPAVWAFWIRSIRRVYPQGPDLAFSSEDYGDELARYLGARHVSVDPGRRRVPVSGTLVRSRPWRYWEFIPKEARPYFVQRIAIIGAESTGKTTLARQLARHFHGGWVPEFARDYLIARKLVCRRSDMLPIARGQVRTEDAAARQAKRFLFCDTDLLTTRTWSEHYFGLCDPRIRQMARERPFALRLLLKTDLPWENDGARDCPARKNREWFYRRFRDQLRTWKCPFVIIGGRGKTRLRNAIRAIRRRFPGIG
jgi:NadR type nicotinamide-nucleotide adenylyltransferase